MNVTTVLHSRKTKTLLISPVPKGTATRPTAIIDPPNAPSSHSDAVARRVICCMAPSFLVDWETVFGINNPFLLVSVLLK